MGLLQREKLKKTVNYIIIPMMNPLEYEKYIDSTAKSVDSLKNYFGAGKSRNEFDCITKNHCSTYFNSAARTWIGNEIDFLKLRFEIKTRNRNLANSQDKLMLNESYYFEYF